MRDRRLVLMTRGGLLESPSPPPHCLVTPPPLHDATSSLGRTPSHLHPWYISLTIWLCFSLSLSFFLSFFFSFSLSFFISHRDWLLWLGLIEILICNFICGWEWIVLIDVKLCIFLFVNEVCWVSWVMNLYELFIVCVMVYVHHLLFVL